ncbi:MAG: sodium:proton antiporter [Lachnospiraceae bacterium]|nr:sodium:proton antiporter [Lachnospiraceae bacterium]
MNNVTLQLIEVHQLFFVLVMCILAILLFLLLIRACKGPTVADRLISVNMMGTMIMVIICILAVIKGEGYLVDIAIIYAMLSFLAVVLLTKVIMGIHKKEEFEEAARAVEEEKSESAKSVDRMVDSREVE